MSLPPCGGFFNWRILMRKRKSFLEMVRGRDPNINTDSIEYIRICKVINILYNYYRLYDLDNGTIHSKIIEKLYLSPKTYTYQKIADKLYISISTLKRYIKQYERLAEIIYNSKNI